MVKENLDASVIKYNAIKDAKTALYNKEFKCASVKTQADDVLTKVATNWLSNKQVLEQ